MINRHDANRAAAIRALQRIGRGEWPKDQARPLLDTVTASIRKIPAESRTAPDALAALEFAHALCGLLPADEAQLYVTREDDLYLVGTAEVPLAALHLGEILAQDALPARYAGYSTCFRREAGTYGKDMGGMFRVHQFDKVEMFSFTTPEASWVPITRTQRR